jgi:hypothetical protein
MIYQLTMSKMQSITFESKYREIIKPGNFLIFTVSIERSTNYKTILNKYGLLDKIIYTSEPSWTAAHPERQAPSSFCIICAC